MKIDFVTLSLDRVIGFIRKTQNSRPNDGAPRAWSVGEQGLILCPSNFRQRAFLTLPNLMLVSNVVAPYTDPKRTLC